MVLELILSLVTNDSVKARSVVELTTNKYFQRSWSSVYRTIENFYCARDESLNIRDGQRLKVREDIEKYLISKLINEGKNLLQIDTTVSSKKDSKKAIDRTYIRQNANNRPVAGYEYSVVCIGAQPKWSVPISINRVKSDENKYSKGSKQIMKIVKQIPPKLTLCWVPNIVKMENVAVAAYSHLTTLTLFGKPFYQLYWQSF